MKRFRPYLPILWMTVLNLANLLWRVGRQIVLPGRKKSGNLLTSTFQLFAGLVEQAISCRREVMDVPLDFTIKIPAGRYLKVWLRRWMLVAAWALFILTSLEWSGGQVKETVVEQTISVAAVAEEAAPIADLDIPVRRYDIRAIVGLALPPKPLTKRWLLLRSLRI